MKTYEFNKHGVCTNPDILTVKGRGKYDEASIKLAQRPDGNWVYGFSWTCDNAGQGNPVWSGGTAFAGKEAAQSWAAQALKKALDLRCKEANFLLQAINTGFVRQQLSLF